MSTFLLHVIWSFSVVRLLAFPSLAQQPQDSPSAPSAQQTPKKQEAQSSASSTKSTPVQGKTKLERETGTVNDRILEVMPNYGTVENADSLPPISSSQKYRLATAGVLDYFTFPFIGALAANNSPSSWG